MANDRRQEKGVPHVRTRDDRHTGLPRPLPQLRRPPGLLRRPVGDPAARRGNAIRGCGMEEFRQFLTAASFCTRQQGSTRRGALQQESRASRLPAAVLSGVVSVDVAILHTQEPPPILPKIRKVRRSRQAGHWGRLPMRSGSPHAGPPPPAKIHENVQSPQAALVPIFRVLMRFWLPIRPGGLPIYRRRFPCLVAFPIRFRGLPCDSTASHTQAIFPYGIVVSPYNYMPDAFPHTLHQISIGRPSPHTVSADPHTIHKLQKSDFNFGETSVRSPQTPNQP